MIILTTGKGGVGKTTVSAATALALANQGARTVVASVDPAHSLGDVLEHNIGGVPTPICENLDAIEVTLSVELQTHWGNIQRYLTRVFESQGVQSWLAEDAAYLPGLEEIASLLRLRQLAADYDYVVLDCPPTGSTLRYLNLPEAVRWYMEKFFPTEKRIIQAIGPMAEKLVGVPMPDIPVLDQIQNLFQEVLSLRQLLVDHSQTVAQVVSTSESVVLKEAERAVGYLHVHGVACGRVVLNRTTANQQAKIAARFAPLPTLSMQKQKQEPVGLKRLTALANQMFIDHSVVPQVLNGGPVKLNIQTKQSSMQLQMPKNANQANLKVGRQGDDLIIDLGPVRRYVPLPPAIAKQRLIKAAWIDEGVKLEFSA